MLSIYAMHYFLSWVSDPKPDFDNKHGWGLVTSVQLISNPQVDYLYLH